MLNNERLKTFDYFTDLDLPRPLLRALEDIGFKTPTPVQQSTIPAALDGKDVLATAQTGTGKTAAFGIPAVDFLTRNGRDRVLVLAPTRELAMQIFDVFQDLSKGMRLYGVLLVGGQSFKKQLDEIRKGVDFIIATPGRLIDHVEQRTINLGSTGMLVLDEVDRMLDMGFLPQIKQVMRVIPKHRQTLLFSATLPPEIERLADSLLHRPVRVAIGPVAQPSATIAEQTIHTTDRGKDGVLLKEVESRRGRILIFTRTKIRADRVAKFLSKNGHVAVCLHGDKTQSHRTQAIEKFRSGRVQIMVATDLAGRGLDIPDIEHVINYDVSATREDHVHRIGRTGRAGKEGNAVSLLSANDVDGAHVVAGTKKPTRVVFRSPRKKYNSVR